jgi:hypothetical protein
MGIQGQHLKMPLDRIFNQPCAFDLCQQPEQVLGVARIRQEQRNPLTLFVRLRGMVARDQVSPPSPGVGVQGRLHQQVAEAAQRQSFPEALRQRLQISRERLEVKPVNYLHGRLPDPFKPEQQLVMAHHESLSGIFDRERGCGKRSFFSLPWKSFTRRTIPLLVHCNSISGMEDPLCFPRLQNHISCANGGLY